jgi:hypothetical protein
VGSRAVLDAVVKRKIPSPDRPARSRSLYRLSYMDTLDILPSLFLFVFLYWKYLLFRQLKRVKPSILFRFRINSEIMNPTDI